MSDGGLLDKIQNFVKPSSENSNMDQSTNTHSVFPNDTANSAYENMQNLEHSAADKARSAANYVQDSAQNARNSAQESAQNVQNSAQNNTNSPAQNFKDTVANGPIAQGVKSEYANTRSEFQNLANSRQRPSETTATGQPLTHYHSMFYNLLSWQNPRATAIAYLTTVALIFAGRYLPLLRYLFKGLYLSLGVTATAEIVGRALFNNGFATQIRPRRYFTLNKDSVDSFLDDVHELINFFVIELQRVFFAENIGYTVTVFLFSLLSYYLIKLVPLWGFALISTTALYLGPFIYLNNKELIDNQLRNLSQTLNQQAVQVKDLAAQKASRARELATQNATKAKELATQNAAKARELANQNAAKAKEKAQAYTNDASTKAQQYTDAAKQRVGSQTHGPNGAASDQQDYTPGQASYNSSDFPSAPQTGPTPIADQFSSSGYGGSNAESDPRLRYDGQQVPASY